MSKKQSIALCGLFVLFILVCAVLNLCWPDREFSPMENRTLAQRPDFSWKGLFSAEWTQAFETYLTDQFPLRDTWVGLKYICERAMLKQENNGIYFAGDRLIARFDPPDETRVEQNFAAIDALAQNTGLPTRFMLVPTSAYIYQDELPANAPSYDQQQLLDRASQLQQAENIPVAQALLDIREEYIYYRTDHHWTTKGAYLAYEAYMKAAGREDEILTQEELEAVKQETPDFCGTLYSQAGARFYEPDTITWYDFPGLTMEQPGKEPTSIYDRSYLDQKDKYSLFFGGNPPALTIRNENPEAHGTLLVVKDSFANSLLPYLAESYEEIYVFDPRYNRTPISEYAAQCGADEILVLYQTGNFAEDVNVGLLSR